MGDGETERGPRLSGIATVMLGRVCFPLALVLRLYARREEEAEASYGVSERVYIVRSRICSLL